MEKWNEFLSTAQDILIGFLKIALIYLIFYLSTSVFYLLDLKIDVADEVIIKKIQFWSLVIVVVLITMINLIKHFVILAKETVRGMSEVKIETQAWYSFIPISEDLSTQAQILNDSKVFRFHGLRLNNALNRNDFVEALSKVEKIKILILARVENAKTSYENKHNNKYGNSLQILKNLISNNLLKGSIEIRETNEFPKNNVLIFDDLLVRLKNYDNKTWSAKDSPIRIYHKLVHMKKVEGSIEGFENMFLKSELIVKHNNSEIPAGNKGYTQ